MGKQWRQRKWLLLPVLVLVLVTRQILAIGLPSTVLNQVAAAVDTPTSFETFMELQTLVVQNVLNSSDVREGLASDLAESVIASDNVLKALETTGAGWDRNDEIRNALARYGRDGIRSVESLRVLDAQLEYSITKYAFLCTDYLAQSF